MEHRREYNPEVIGANLRRLRLKHRLTVEQVRQYLCMGSVQAIYKYESGKSQPPADTLLALMELYNASVKDIVEVPQTELFDFKDYVILNHKDVLIEITDNRTDRLLRYQQFYKSMAS